MDLKDAVVAVKDEQGKVKLHQSVDFSADGTFSFSFLGSLTGLILLNAAASAACGALTEVGIDARLMKELAATLSSGSSVLFVLTGIPTPHRDKLLEELKGTGGKILRITLSHEDQSALQAALSAAREGSLSVVVRQPGPGNGWQMGVPIADETPGDRGGHLSYGRFDVDMNARLALL
jgi:uncharacterized membrane protein